MIWVGEYRIRTLEPSTNINFRCENWCPLLDCKTLDPLFAGPNDNTVMNPLIRPRPVFNFIGDVPVKCSSDQDLIKGYITILIRIWETSIGLFLEFSQESILLIYKRPHRFDSVLVILSQMTFCVVFFLIEIILFNTVSNPTNRPGGPFVILLAKS